MPNSITTKIVAAASICVMLTLLVGYANYKNDPFSGYRDFIKKPLSIKPKQLKYYDEEEQLIRTKLKLSLSQRERVILAGLHWLITFADEDKNFDSVFADFMLLMNKLTESENRTHQKEVAQSIVKKSFARAENKLAKLFTTDKGARFGFIGLFHILMRHPEFQKSYFKFYQEFFKAPLPSDYDNDLIEFSKAIGRKDYQTLFGILLESSFLHYYLVKARTPHVELPPDKFTQYLKGYEHFNYVSHPVESSQFRELGYLATHIVYFLTNYGEFAKIEDVNMRKAKAYIESSLENVRHKLGDFDLLAEYAQCLKILGSGDDSRIKDLEKFIYSLQRPDGSWGSNRDFKTNSYTAIHPTGAALMALNQSNG